MSCAASASLLSQLSEFLAVRLGLHFPMQRWADLDRGIAEVARELGMRDTESCIRTFLAAPLSRKQMELLASHLTVGETYFFRDPAVFAVFEAEVLPELRARVGSKGRPLRIWSASCSTGEEAYSIAICLDRSWGRVWAEHALVLATDINPRFLRKAAEGIYTEWSFRATPEPIRTRYFSKRPDGGFAIDSPLRRQVSFSCLNLAEDTYPSLLNNTNAMDVIFCRNVLMYFTPEQARRVIARLRRSLVDGGWLIVSPTDVSSALLSDFERVEFPGTVLYRKKGAQSAGAYVTTAPVVRRKQSAEEAVAELRPGESPAPRAAEHSDEPRAANIQVRPAPGFDPLARSEHAAEQAAPAQSAEAACRNAQECANRGDLSQARTWCERAIAADKLNAARYYLLATILQEQGETTEAAAALGRALYLEPAFVMAHFTLANLMRSAGQQGEAERHFRQTRLLLKALPVDEIVPASEGLTAGRILDVVDAIQSDQTRTPRRTG